MREIKFRAWNPKGNMLNPFHLGDGTTNEKLIYDDQWSLMQFTGLHDKNGKEIYEGDVVSNNSINWKVDFYDGSFVIREIGKETNKWHIIGEDTHCEVIGNIYENPELIKK